MPGIITALVQTDILDSIGAQRVLIPKGSRLIGAYSAGANVDQEKVMTAFTRQSSVKKPGSTTKHNRERNS